MFPGGINNIAHPRTYRTVYTLDLTGLVREKHLPGDNTELENYFFSFFYELFAKGC